LPVLGPRIDYTSEWRMGNPDDSTVPSKAKWSVCERAISTVLQSKKNSGLQFKVHRPSSRPLRAKNPTAFDIYSHSQASSKTPGDTKGIRLRSWMRRTIIHSQGWRTRRLWETTPLIANKSAPSRSTFFWTHT
jgi:hypothetical protein